MDITERQKLNGSIEDNIKAEVILDSISPTGYRLTTMEVTFHRFILPEFNTHRSFSRNSASSRAIPLGKTLERVAGNPAFAVSWPREQRGMQGGEDLFGQALQDAQDLVSDLHEYTTKRIEDYITEHPEKSDRLHKSVINRYLEPFSWHTVIVSATEWDNFWEQRCSSLAQPEIRVPAEKMRIAYEVSTPVEVGHDSWHTPYILSEEYEELSLKARKAVSAARCARVSYLTHDGLRDINKDIDLYNRLVTAVPAHFSPLEHVAKPAVISQHAPGNFVSWQQHRHEVESMISRGEQVAIWS